ncbi:LysR substrate-binding domain-containing protein [Klebsiella variicola subsp. variicola]|nr:LysR substrate-binding domain-containing protein [Klebsiella variicola subsp. variicola]
MGIAFEPSPTHNLLFTPLAVDRFVAIVPRQSPLAKKKQPHLAGAVDPRFYYPAASFGGTPDAGGGAGAQRSPAGRRLESHQLVTVGRMVASGLGQRGTGAV